MHGAEDEDDKTHLDAEGFYDLLRIADDVAGLQCKHSIAQVDEVEPNHQKIIYAVGQLFIAVKNID